MPGRLPAWFKQKVPNAEAMRSMQALLDASVLHTVCQSAQCPNCGQCFSRKTATFMILGDTCTRRCAFCAVNKGTPSTLDPEEPDRLAQAARSLGLRYVVVTSVTRDDLSDGGAAQFAGVVDTLHENGIAAEVLVPDFQGSLQALSLVVASRPDVFNHNIETAPRLYPRVRPGADYARSLELLHRAKSLSPGMLTKSGLMVGLGEDMDEVVIVLRDLRDAGCDLLTIGQYLQPSPHHHPVVRFVPPGEFDDYAGVATELGFAGVASGPLVRSSYHAVEMYAGINKKRILE